MSTLNARNMQLWARNEQLWQYIIVQRKGWAKAGRVFGLSTSRVRQIIFNIARREAYQLSLSNSELIHELRIAFRVIT